EIRGPGSARRPRGHLSPFLVRARASPLRNESVGQANPDWLHPQTPHWGTGTARPTSSSSGVRAGGLLCRIAVPGRKLRRHQPFLVSDDDRLDSVAQAELAKHVGDVRLNRVLAEDELRRDLGV